MAMEEVVDRLKSDKEEGKKWVGVYIGVLAVLLAISNVGGANAAKDATRANIEASNSWAFYQAKNIRRVSFTLAADELELRLATQQALAAPAKKSVEDKIKSYRAEADRLKLDPEDGMDALLTKAKSLEAERDVALRKDPYFDWSQALLQIANRAGLRIPDHRQLDVAGTERSSCGTRHFAGGQRLHTASAPAVAWIGLGHGQIPP